MLDDCILFIRKEVKSISSNQSRNVGLCYRPSDYQNLSSRLTTHAGLSGIPIDSLKPSALRRVSHAKDISKGLFVDSSSIS